MDATCAIQDSIHVFSLVRKYVSRILGTYQKMDQFFGIFVMATKKWNIIICEYFTTIDPRIKILEDFNIFVKILDR